MNIKCLRGYGAILLLSFILTACSIGGGGDNPPPANSPPTVSGPILNSVNENGADYTLTLSDLLINASDLDGDTLSVNDFEVASGDISGITINSNQIHISPSAYSTLRAGETEVIEINFIITDGNGGSVPTTLEITIVGLNLSTPVAIAGGNQTGVDVNTTIQLDGSASSDDDGDPLIYSWTLVSAPATSVATLSDMNTVNPMFTPDIEGSYVFGLVVNDGQLDSARDTVGIATSGSSAPIARVGVGGLVDSYDRITEVNLGTELIAWDSFDADGDTLYYHWTLESVPTASTATVGEIFTATSAQPFLPDAVGVYRFTLAVDDGVLSANNTVPVMVTALDSAEVFTSADNFPLDIPDNDVVTGVTSTIDVSDAPSLLDYVRVSVNIDHPGPSRDIEIFLESPAGTMIELSTGNQYLFSNSLEPSTDLVLDDYLGVGILGSTPAPVIFVPEQSLDDLDGEDANGTWGIHVFDNTETNTGSLLGWRLVFPGLPVFADAGADQTVAAGTDFTVTLNGGNSVATSGNALNYRWVFVDRPEGSAATIDDPSAVMPTFVTDVAGDYVIELVVDDGVATSLPDHVTISAQLPIANISTPGLQVRIIEPGQSISLDGSTSSTLSGAMLTYNWQLTQVPAGSAAFIDFPNSETPSFIPDIEGNYVVELVVDDGFAQSQATATRFFTTGASATIYNSDDSFPIAITDRTTFTSTINVSGGTTSINSISVYLDITHTFTADLDIFLIAPSGQRVMLTSDNGGSGDNFTNTIFTDLAIASVVGSAAPFTGFFRPEEPLSPLESSDANGVWTLEVTDDAGADQGTLNSWQLEIFE